MYREGAGSQHSEPCHYVGRAGDPRTKMSDELSQVDPDGNTETSGSTTKKPSAVQYYQWFFTLHMEYGKETIKVIQESQVWQVLREHCKKFGFQLERGAEGGKHHYQGWFSLETKERFTPLKNKLGWPHIHLEPLRDLHRAMAYCSKAETYVAGPWTESHRPLVNIIDTLRPWQVQLHDEIKGYVTDRRKVIWYVDEKGNEGKSTFSIWLTRQRGLGVYRFPGSSKRDCVAYCLKECEPKCVIFDFARDDFHTCDYGLLEELKNGQLFSQRYKSVVVDFDPPMVIVFANTEPELKKMSADRWDIRRF